VEKAAVCFLPPRCLQKRRGTRTKDEDEGREARPIAPAPHPYAALEKLAGR